MVKNMKKILVIFLMIVLLFSTVTVFADDEVNSDEVNSDEIKSDESAVLNQDSTQAATQNDGDYKKSDVYLTGDNITIDYIVDGNLFVVANKVTINSQIGGDAFICAKDIVVGEDGYVFNNLFAAAASIEIKGVIYDLYGVANQITISNGYVYRDLRATCNNLTINGTVGRNAFVSCNELKFNTNDSTNGIIYGNLKYSASAQMEIPDNVVSGNVEFSKLDTDVSVGTIISGYIMDLGTFIAFVICVWLICLWLAPKFLGSTNNVIKNSIWKTLGFGLLTLIVVPLIAFVLLLVGITAKLAVVTILAYVLLAILAKAIFTIAVNNYACSKLNINKNIGVFGMLIVSSLVVWLICIIPFVGGLVSFVALLFGIGSIVTSIIPSRKAKAEKVEENKVIEVAKEAVEAPIEETPAEEKVAKTTKKAPAKKTTTKKSTAKKTTTKKATTKKTTTKKSTTKKTDK